MTKTRALTVHDVMTQIIRGNCNSKIFLNQKKINAQTADLDQEKERCLLEIIKLED